ncbi:hypothetical protein PSR1_00900 [Anaeromyxobacter sp. PSR-1]|nr:hypothetical protein PSR1_00900 [Anaeromyxobacter sp. PSR-1]
MEREAEHGAPGGGGRAGGVHRAEVREQRARRLERGRGRRLQPLEVRGRPEAGQRQQRLREVLAQDLRDLELGPRVVVVARVEPHRAPGPRAAGAPGPLRRRGAADLLHLERGQAGPGRVRGDPGEAGVHHRHHAVDGDRGLGHVGGEDHLAARSRPHRAILLLRRQVAVQRQHVHAGAGGPGGERLAGAADLGRAGQEHEHVAVQALAVQAPHRPRHALLQPQVRRRRLLRREVLHRDLEAPPLRAERRRAQERRHRAGVERGRHRDELQIGAGRALEPPEEREREVALQVALVELVEHHRADAGERGLGEQAPGQEPLGHVADAGARARHLVEPHLVADRLAGPLAQLLGHPPGGHAGGEPPRLEHHHLARAGQPGLVQRARHAGGLPRAGGRLDHERGAGAERGDDLGEERVDGERLHRPLLTRRGEEENRSGGDGGRA